MPSQSGCGRRAAVDFVVWFGCDWNFRVFFSFFFLRTNTVCSKYEAPSFIYLSTSTGVRPGCHYLIVCLSVCLRNIRRFTDYESCTRPISTSPGSMEAGEYGLTRGTCFVPRRLEVVTVAGLLWISWRVLGAAGIISCFPC